MPGLIDAHGHIESLGASLEQVDLRGVASLDEVARRVKARMDAMPGDSWITGGNWDQSLWPGGEFPTAAVLDAVAPDRPVWLTPGRRPRRLGQLRGHAPGRGRPRTPRPPRTARSFATRTGSRPASSSTARWAWSDGSCRHPKREDIKRRILAAQETDPRRAG